MQLQPLQVSSTGVSFGSTVMRVLFCRQQTPKDPSFFHNVTSDVGNKVRCVVCKFMDNDMKLIFDTLDMFKISKLNSHKKCGKNTKAKV